jgi:aldehyde dehydrogenase (NAD(P)+)
VLLKLNPTMAEMEDVYRAALAPLLDAGVLRIVQGGAETGAYLTQHPDIAHIHITGSAVTHDAIVWGLGEEGAQRRAAGTPLLEKPISSELGGVSPVIVVPGDWSQADLDHQAAHVATMRLQNGGYNCIAGQLVILSSDWPQKDAFLDALRRAMESAPQRPAWYPGSDDRVASALESYPDAQRLGQEGGRVLAQLDAANAATLQTTEYFSPVLGVREVPGLGQHFLDAAVDLSNDDLVGTLGANVLIDPATRKTLGHGFDQAMTRLRYGTIAINTWTAFGFTSAAATWGAFPGHTLEDVQSGRGIVHNALLLDDVERTVVEGPFRPFPRSLAGGESSLFPTPPWFVTARSAATTGRRITELAADPSWRRLPAVLAAAFRA